ncbi:MAG: DsbA family protein [Planctomycetota bacterium]|nr:MAG: DsbA family protein [Planctomycetota bacterium]
MESEARILYVADPMCSWCWGFAPVLAHLEASFPDTRVQIVLGGLAPDSAEPMEPDVRAYVQKAWRDVAARTGAEFNFDFWEKCAPRRSTWPACRAVVVARRFDLERAMFAAIQDGYYLQAQNPSDEDTLANLAATLGMDQEGFLQELGASQTQMELEADFELRRSLGATSFPSLGVSFQGRMELLHSGWCNREEVEKMWKRWRDNSDFRNA